MNDGGYSDKPLIEKLDYRPGETVLLIDAPKWFQAYLRTSGLKCQIDPSGKATLDKLAITPSVKPRANWGHAFFTTLLSLESFCETTNLSHIEKGWWLSWPKRSSGLVTDLTEQNFRDLVLPMGWVDTKVCAVDDTWSGLKFLRRNI